MNINEWTWRRKVTIMFLALVIAYSITTPFTKGYIVHGECVDSDTLWEYTNITIEGSSPLDIDLGTVDCPYGCFTNGSAFGDDCRDMPVNNSGFGLIIWGIGVAFAIGAWRMKGAWGAWTGSILMLGLSLWFAWYVQLALGLIPFAVSMMMIMHSVGLSTKPRRR